LLTHLLSISQVSVLEDTDRHQAFNAWEERSGLKLSGEQSRAMLQPLVTAPFPICDNIVKHLSTRFNAATSEKEVSTLVGDASLRHLVNSIFDKAEELCGPITTATFVSMVELALPEPLTASELEDVLSLDDDVLGEQMERSGHIPVERRLPGDVLLQLTLEMTPLLDEAGEYLAVCWQHDIVSVVARERYLSDAAVCQQRMELLADYADGKWALLKKSFRLPAAFVGKSDVDDVGA
jgi:hypothetical protein